MRPGRICPAALVALGCLTAASSAEDLFLLRSGADEIVLLDRASVVRQGARAQAWVIERRERAGGARTEKRSLYVFDCAARTIGLSDASARTPPLAPPRSALERTLLAYACGR